MIDNQDQANLAKQPLSATPSAEQPLTAASPTKKGWNTWIFLVIFILIILGIGGYFLLGKSANPRSISKNNSLPTTVAISPTTAQPLPTATNNSLNPNTGNLYSDIKTKLDQVIK